MCNADLFFTLKVAFQNFILALRKFILDYKLTPSNLFSESMVGNFLSFIRKESITFQQMPNFGIPCLNLVHGIVFSDITGYIFDVHT